MNLFCGVFPRKNESTDFGFNVGEYKRTVIGIQHINLLMPSDMSMLPQITPSLFQVIDNDLSAVLFGNRDIL